MTHTDGRTLSITQRLAQTSAHHPWRVLAAWGLVLLASFVTIATMLGSALTTDAEITTRPDSVQASDLIAAAFANKNNVDEGVVIYAPANTADQQEFRDFVTQTRNAIRDTGETQVVTDPYAEASPAISKDGHAVAVLLTLGTDPEDGIASVIDQVDAADADPAYQVDIGGEFTLGNDFNELSTQDLSKGELQFGLPAALIVLLLVFGAVVAALIPMGVAILSIIVAVAVSALVGQVTSLSFFIVNMITAMGLALGIDYSLFVVSRYREQRAHGFDKVEAIVTTGGTASKAVLFSGTSFVVALLGLLLVPDTILRSLALGAIIVGLVTMVAALTLLPALLALLGDRVDAWRLPFFGRKQAAESPFWTKAVRGVVKHPACVPGGRRVRAARPGPPGARPAHRNRRGQHAARHQHSQGRLPRAGRTLPPQRQLRPRPGRDLRRRQLRCRRHRHGQPRGIGVWTMPTSVPRNVRSPTTGTWH